MVLQGAETKRQFVEKRNAVVERLLAISPSAIHLRFVWRHLMRYRQELLDRFLDSGAAFRGVFYGLPPPKKVRIIT
jgi:hypothetical protein